MITDSLGRSVPDLSGIKFIMSLQCQKGISTGISVYVHACIHVSVDMISVWATTPTVMEFIHKTLRGGCMLLRRCVKTKEVYSGYFGCLCLSNTCHKRGEGISSGLSYCDNVS